MARLFRPVPYDPFPEASMALTQKQALFAREFLIDMNAAAAYVRAGYTAANDQVAASCAYKLLRNAHIQEAIDDAQCARVERLDLTADWVVTRFRLLYLQAAQDRDYPAALRALENIGKYLGLYERHNVQKKYTRDDLERLRTELEQAGFDFRAVNLPSVN